MPYYRRAYVAGGTYFFTVNLRDRSRCLLVDYMDFSTRWRLIKTRFVRAISRSDVWQRRFWEHSIGNEHDLIAHLDYIHFNPVKHRHVTRPIDWPYSSFHRFVATGMYSADWAASPAVPAWNRE